ncbi:unnamed protein product [Chironomus riparius]|uniref:VWFC domain-containing protein n=1 Tax=Chironomus riparius TaxID=315576 RepID=A0A9P0NGJ4_9DIPT|nr:unnamed protein product [Chironomus riparius]
MNVLYVKKIVICFYVLFVQFCCSTPYKNYSNNNKNNNNGNDIAVAVQNKNTESSKMGCLHNNTMFADTSIIPTTEPCLVCKCSKRNLVCVRRVCKDQPYPPPRGCILVQKASSCCPYLSCSKYHVNYYKNSERNHDENINNHYQQITHEKTLEKNSRADDVEEMNGGCIESGSLYASGSAMYRSSSSYCQYCYCINGQQKCVKPKCILKDTRCKPIYSKASCCPIKYDCNNNSTAVISNIRQGSDNKIANVHRRNRSNGCMENDRYYEEGEKLPIDETRPCEVCYCIKGARKCTVNKCAPVIRGCIPKLHTEGSCCPTSYDCRRSIKFKRESRQNEDEEEEDNDSIDFFSLLFGSDDPKENEEVTEIPVPTLPPFKSLPTSATTESSFFDLIRAGLEIIDANADKIDTKLNNIISTTQTIPTTSEAPRTTLESTDKKIQFNYSTKIVSTTSLPSTKTVNDIKSTEKKTFDASTEASKIRTSMTSNVNETKKLETITDTVETLPLTSTTLSIKSTSDAVVSSTKMSIVEKTTSSPTIIKSSTKASAIKVTTARTTKAPKVTSTTTKIIATASPVKINLPTTISSTVVSSKRVTTKTVPPTTKPPATMRTTTPKKYIVPSSLEHQLLPVLYTADVPSDSKLIVNDENEADALPNLEIIPFVAHDAIKTDKYELPYRQSSYDNLEKDYFANDKEKPFRYNNKFIHHNYDETFDYVNPNERIDTGPFYYENNESQFDSFSPPNEQDFLGGFSPKDSIYDEVSTSAKYETPLKHNDYIQKPLDTSTIHEHKSYLTSTEKTPTLAINQTNDTRENQQKEKHKTTISGFKKISSNLTSFIDDLLHANALEETKMPLITTTTASATHSSSTSAPIKSIINDDDFIIKHLKVSSTSSTTTMKNAPSMMEIFSKPTNPTMNGLLKLAGCNIYGQMYDVGHVIDELSNECLECKCLPDIGVGCVPLKC